MDRYVCNTYVHCEGPMYLIWQIQRYVCMYCIVLYCGRNCGTYLLRTFALYIRIVRSLFLGILRTLALNLSIIITYLGFSHRTVPTYDRAIDGQNCIFATYIHRRPLTADVAHHLYYIQLVDIFRYVGTYVALSYLVHTFSLDVAVSIAHNIHLALLTHQTHILIMAITEEQQQLMATKTSREGMYKI